MFRNLQGSISGRNPAGRAFHCNALFWQPAPLLLIANRRGGSQRHFRCNPLRLWSFGDSLCDAPITPSRIHLCFGVNMLRRDALGIGGVPKAVCLRQTEPPESPRGCVRTRLWPPHTALKNPLKMLMYTLYTALLSGFSALSANQILRPDTAPNAQKRVIMS